MAEGMNPRVLGVGALLVLAWLVVVLDDPMISGAILVAGGLALVVLGEQRKLQPRPTALLLGSLNVLVGVSLVGGLLVAVVVCGLAMLVAAAAIVRHHEDGDRTDHGGWRPPAAA